MLGSSSQTLLLAYNRAWVTPRPRRYVHSSKPCTSYKSLVQSVSIDPLASVTNERARLD